MDTHRASRTLWGCLRPRCTLPLTRLRLDEHFLEISMGHNSAERKPLLGGTVSVPLGDPFASVHAGFPGLAAPNLSLVHPQP